MIVLCSFLLGTAHAQFVKSIGLKGGVVWANQNWDLSGYSEGDYNYRVDFHIAANAEFFQHKYVSLLAQGGYIRKGHQSEWNNWESNFVCSYLYFAPMLKARINIDKFIPYLFIGPRVDFYLSHQDNGVLYYDERLTDNMENFIFGLHYGLGFEYLIGSIGIVTTFTHQYDFSLAFDGGSSLGLQSIKNNAFILDLGIKYYFGR